MRARVDAAERMLDLVIALSHTRHRMTKAEIRTKVNGYDPAGSTEAFERMFERDKEALRDLGVPIVTLTDAVHEDEIGYRIDTTSYEIAPVNLSPAQMGVLSLAAEIWHDSTFSGAARRGLTKLRAISGGGGAVEPEPGLDASVRLRLRGPDPVIGDLIEAVTSRTPVTFSYRAAYSGEVSVRRVEPWRIHARDRGWYLVGLDRGRQARRSFRTSRITSAVRPIGDPGSYEIPADHEDAEPADGAPTHHEVVLAVRPESAAALRVRADGGPIETARGRDLLRLRSSDLEELAEEVAGYGDAVLVLEPHQLRDRVLRRLQAVASLGSGMRQQEQERR